jgi:hypothetical protein
MPLAMTPKEIMWSTEGDLLAEWQTKVNMTTQADAHTPAIWRSDFHNRQSKKMTPAIPVDTNNGIQTSEAV